MDYQSEIISTLFSNTTESGPDVFNEHEEIASYANTFGGLDDLLNDVANDYDFQPPQQQNTDVVTDTNIEELLFDLNTMLEGRATDEQAKEEALMKSKFDEIRDRLKKNHLETPEIEVSNVVCKSNIGCRVNLKDCNQRLKHSSLHTHQKFPALFIRLKNPDLSILLFTTGNVVVTGARSYESACVAISRLVSSLCKLNYPAKVGHVKIENFVAKVCMGFPVKLTELQRDVLHERYCEKQNGRFPCINYRIMFIEPRITVRVFSNGIFLIQSAKSMETLKATVEHMVYALHQFRNFMDVPVDCKSLIPLFDKTTQYPEFVFVKEQTFTMCKTPVPNEAHLTDPYDVTQWIDMFCPENNLNKSRRNCLTLNSLCLDENDVIDYFKRCRRLFVCRSNFTKSWFFCNFDCVGRLKEACFLPTDTIYLIDSGCESIDRHFLVLVENNKVVEACPYQFNEPNTWLSTKVGKEELTKLVLMRLWHFVNMNVVPPMTNLLKTYVVHCSFCDRLNSVRPLQILSRNVYPDKFVGDSQFVNKGNPIISEVRLRAILLQ